MIGFVGFDLWGWIFAALMRPIRARLDRLCPGPVSCVVVHVELAPLGPRYRRRPMESADA